MSLPEIHWQFNDGGRAAAGYKGTAGDCVCRAIAIATEWPYQQVYSELNALAATERTGRRKRGHSNARNGVYTQCKRRFMEGIGWEWTPTMAIGSGCKVHLRADELPKGRLVVSVSKHSVAVIDGVIHDTHDCSRGGTRCVYGYWQAPWDPALDGAPGDVVAAPAMISSRAADSKTEVTPLSGREARFQKIMAAYATALGDHLPGEVDIRELIPAIFDAVPDAEPQEIIDAFAWATAQLREATERRRKARGDRAP